MSYATAGAYPTIEHARQAVEEGAEVTMETTLDRSSVTYSILIGGRLLWSREVYFGQTDATVAGGSDFVRAAREQERIATEMAYGRATAVLP